MYLLICITNLELEPIPYFICVGRNKEIYQEIANKLNNCKSKEELITLMINSDLINRIVNILQGNDQEYFLCTNDCEFVVKEIKEVD